MINAVLAVVTAAPLLAVPQPLPSAAPGAAAARWTSCGPALPGLECRTVGAPLDHARPGGKKISLAVSRVPHLPGGKYQGVLLVNPGGPGGSGLGFAAAVAAGLPDDLRRAYDVIGFDPRGVGASRPAISCDRTYMTEDRPAYRPRTARAAKRWLKRAETYAKSCGRRYGDLLRHMTTLDAARDVDVIRTALGVPQINYYGGSYGTYLGAVYATKFPSRVRRMVLDSNVRPSRIWYPANLDQDVAFQKNINAYFRWIAQHHRVYKLGKTRKAVATRFYKTRRALDASPAGGQIDGNELTDTLQTAAYTTQWWPGLAGVWSLWERKRNASGLIRARKVLASPTDNDYAVYNAVGCTDAAWPRSWRRWKRDATALHRRAPFTTWQNTWFNAPCLFWPAPAGRPVKISSRARILLLQATEDAATPFRGGVEMHRLLPNSALVVERGGRTHVIAGNGSACVDGRFHAYLRGGALPATPVSSCPRPPAPKPAEAS